MQESLSKAVYQTKQNCYLSSGKWECIIIHEKNQGNKKSGSYNQGPDNRGSTKLFYEQLCLILTATHKIITISVKRQVHLRPTVPRMKQSKPVFKIQWNFDITKGQGTEKICLL